MTTNRENFLTEQNVVLGLNAVSKTDAIYKLSEILEKNGVITDADDFAKDVLKREAMTTTGIGKNIAIPHGKSKSVKEASMIFAKNKTPLEWHSLDGSKVTIIFLMAISATDDSKAHLKVLANLSGRLMEDDFFAMIKKENDPKKILNIFNEKEE